MADDRTRGLARGVLPHVPVLVAGAATVALERVAQPGWVSTDAALLLLLLWLVALLVWPVWLVHTYLIAPRLDPEAPKPAAGWAVTPIVIAATMLLIEVGAG